MAEKFNQEKVTTKATREPFFNREIALWQAAVLFVVTMAAAGMILSAVGRQYFWRPALSTPVERGLAYFQALVEREPDKPEHWVDLGWYYFQKGDYEQAMEKHRQALALDPGHFGALLNAGLTALKMEDLGAAVQFLEQAVGIDNSSWEAQLTLGVAYIALERWRDAEETLARSLELYQHNAETYYFLGYAVERQGRPEEARELYEEALRYDPAYNEAREGLARIEQDS